VAQFEIIRKLRLLDLTALNDIRVTGSLFDFGFSWEDGGRRVPAVAEWAYHAAGNAR
jgi:hypothetical protein